MADTILVVDDSITVRTAARWVAESDDFRVLEAASLQEASNLLSTEMPSTILLDYQLPDGAGVDFCRNIRANSDFDALRVIILYGEAHPFDPADAHAAGANGVLKKPFRSQTLLDVLQGKLADTPQAQPAATPQAAAGMEAAMHQASDHEEDIIFAAADTGAQTPPGAPPPPTAQPSISAATALPRPPTSGLSKLPPMPGSGVHRIPPPGGQQVSVAGRGVMPRSPSGAHRPLNLDEIREPSGARRIPAAQAPSPQDSEPAAPTQDAAALQQATEAETGPVPIVGTRRNEPTAEVNVLSRKEIKEDETVREDAPIPPEAVPTVYQVSEDELRALVEERTKAIVEEVLPNIARQALAHLLRTELNEQIVRMGVTRRVSQFLDNDLPAYAQQAIDRRMKQNEG